MKNKFKKGDKVRVIRSGHFLSHIQSTVNSVRRFKLPFKYFVDTPGFDSQHYQVDEIMHEREWIKVMHEAIDIALKTQDEANQ